MSFTIRNSNDKENTFLNIIVYGPSGVGKTTLAKTVSRPLVISIEDGVLCLVDSGVDYIEVKKYSDVLELVRSIDTDKVFSKYDWIILDSITEVGQNLYPPLREKMNKDSIANGSKGANGMQIWGTFGEMIGNLVKEFRGLKKHTCILALPGEKEIEGITKRAPDIYGKSSERVTAWLDETFYMHIDDKGDRKFLTEATNISNAKDRSGKLDKIEPADLGAVQKKILG